MEFSLFFAGVLALLLLYFLWEDRCHERNLAQLPLRIHVNGTRGKSSVTRLIAGGLRAGGHHVVAKTTGTAAQLILPDGSEEPLKRRGPANIRENIGLLKKAVDLGADTIVFECMALQPELQNFCERRLLKSQIGVITNVRADHEDVMGKGLLNITAALANTIPAQGTLVTTPAAAVLLAPHLHGTRMVVADASAMPTEFLQGFPYPVVPENLALALQVCSLAGVAAATALTGMRQAAPDAGNLHVNLVPLAGKTVRIIDALAANDPDSTAWLWEEYVGRGKQAVVLLNCRPDRKLRTVQLCELLGKVAVAGAENMMGTAKSAAAESARPLAAAFILTGDITFAKNVLRKQNYPAPQIFALPPSATQSDLEKIMAVLDARTLFAAGNIKGLPAALQTLGNGG
jgi:poly-gamma-glutamate synthase PgsB/CapB